LYKIQQITRENFCETSLDGYIRTQNVTEVYRKINGLYKLVHHPFTDDWSPQRKREKALEILGEEFITYGAFDGDRVIGFVITAALSSIAVPILYPICLAIESIGGETWKE